MNIKYDEHKVSIELDLWNDSKGDQKVYRFLTNMVEDLKREELFGEALFRDEYYYESALKKIIVKYMSYHGEDWK